VAAVAHLSARFPESVVKLALDPERLVALVRTVRENFPQKFAAPTSRDEKRVYEA